MNTAPSSHLNQAFLVFILAIGLTFHAPSLQAQALKPAAVAVSSAADPKPTLNYRPKVGESIDSVIANTLGDSPLKIELLRKAYVEINPKAFLPGKVPQLRKGVVLTVPDHELLLRSVLPPKTTDSTAPALKSSSEERRRWVQYP